MTFYKIVVAYDGTDYHGWQFQSGATTVVQALSDAFWAVFFQKISILGASRTDAGVHALGQVAIVQSPIDIDPEQMLRAWSKALSSDIVIKDIKKIDALIHPHDGVISKTYAYYFFTQRPSPFVQRYGWYIHRNVDLDLLRQALNIFVGTHDFRSFCTGNDLTDTIRTIDAISLTYVEQWNAYKIEVKGKSFLRYMVRRIVGACLAVAYSGDHKGLEHIRQVLQQANPCHTLPNAPAKGLVLERIHYEDDKGGLA